MALPIRNPNKEYEALKTAAAQARLPYERDAWLNLAFFLNQQYTQWASEDKGPGFLQEIPRDPNLPNQPRPVFNKIMQYVNQEHASVLLDRPAPDVLPPTDDIQDIMESNVARAYCDHVADPTEANLDRALSRAALWAIITGNGYIKWCWNPAEKRHEIVPCNFFEVYTDPYATDFTKARYVIHTKFMDVEQVYEAWGVEISPNEAESADPTKSALLRGMGAAPVLNGVTVNELWIKPGRRHPNGRYVVWTGRRVLVEPTDHPYEHKRLPFTQLGAIERPDSQFFMSPVTYLRPAQMAFNQYHAQSILNRKNFANPKWWVPSELELEEDPNDSPNQILKGSSGSGLRPELIQPTTMADNGYGAVIEEQMMHIVGLHEVSQAQVPGRVEAAKAIELLKDSDDSRQEVMRKTIETSLAEGFFQILENARQFEPEEKMVTAYSRDGVAEVKRFRAKALKPGYRVRTTKTSGLARSRSARWDQLQRMWDSQIITDPETMAELLEVPVPTFVNHKAVDIRLARNENLDIAKGVAIVPNSWDDHAIHLREHNTFRKTHEFLTLSNEAKQRFEFHCQKHDDMLDAQLVKAAKRAMIAAQVAPPPGGAQAQPSPGGDQAPPPGGDSATSPA